MFGEVAQALVASQHISVDKVLQSEFEFTFPDLDDALKDLL